MIELRVRNVNARTACSAVINYNIRFRRHRRRNVMCRAVGIIQYRRALRIPRGGSARVSSSGVARIRYNVCVIVIVNDCGVLKRYNMI